MIYSSELIAYIDTCRKDNMSWEDISKGVKKQFRLQRNGDTLRKAYKYHMGAEAHNVDIIEYAVRDASTARGNLYKKQSMINTLQRIISSREAFIEEIKETLKGLKPLTKVKPIKKEKNKKSLTLEVMLTDLHIGLKYEGGFDYELAEKRMVLLKECILDEVSRASKIYNIDKIIVNCLGDNIHNELLHPVDSLRASEGPNPQQASECIRILLECLVYSLYGLGIPIDFNCLPGNHDRVDTNKAMCYVGVNSWSWTIYTTLKLMCEAHKMKLVNFNIAKDSSMVIDVYGDKMLLTHGDELKGTDINSVERYIHNRSKQYNVKIDYLRIGHFHEYKMYGRGRFIVSDSFCGVDHYAKRQGYNSPAGQVINYYVKTDHRPTSFYKSFPIYLGG